MTVHSGIDGTGASGSAAGPTRLAGPEAIEFWDQRHRAHDELLSGGDVSLDHATNELFYALRLGRLIDVIGTATASAAPWRVLDAGCGKGYFARAMARFGHRVDGIDSSAAAIEECRQQAAGSENYAVSTLADWQPPYLYDVVYSVDVLFHIMDDSAWERSLSNLAALVRLGGRLVVSDHGTDADRLWGTYQVTRAASRYGLLLVPSGFRVDGFVPYRFRDSLAGFHTFSRVA
jgi:2-polyprenyl-3-methyl-5-hydroxy-6-metoxy-1,4-benzoquinol methylase